MRAGYMPAIVDVTKDIPISLLFNNAGFITTGFFADVDIKRSVVRPVVFVLALEILLKKKIIFAGQL